MRPGLRTFLFGGPLPAFAVAAGLAALAVALMWLASTPLLVSTVSGRVLVDGQPVAGAFFYPMPGGCPQGTTGPDGRFAIDIPLLDAPDTIDVCVVLPDGRRTDFGQYEVPLGWFARQTVDVVFAAR